MKFVQTNRDYIEKRTISDRTDTVLTHSHVSQGEIDISKYKSFTIFPIWTKGDETSAEIKVMMLHTASGDEHQHGGYTNASGTLTQQGYEYEYTTATTKAVPIELDVTGFSILKIYTKATAGTPTGKMKIDYIGSNSK